jgi:hypothetical protein
VPRSSDRSMKTQIRQVKRSLASATRALDRVAAMLQATTNGVPTRRRPLKLTPARRRQMKLQGQYMGLVRNLKPKQKAQLRAIREKKGYEGAIRKAMILTERS